MFKYLKEIKNTQDCIFLSLLIFAICERTIFTFPVLIVSRFFGAESLYDALISLIYLFLFIGAFSSQKRWSYISPWTFVIVFFFFLSILFTLLFHPECKPFLIERWPLDLKRVIPWFLIGTCFYADRISMETIGKWCTFGVLLMSAYLLVFNNQLDEMNGGYDMDSSYRLLLSTLITINYAFYSKNKWSIVASAIGLFFSLTMGTRGPVLIIVSFLIILFAQTLTIKGARKIWLISLLVLGGLFISFIGITQIVTYVVDFLSGFGFSTRVFDMALQDEMFESLARKEIYDTLIGAMKENPFPHGLYSEKLFGYFSAHNMYIEILYYYGVFLGAIILLILVLLPIISYRKSINPLAKQWILMFACFVFIKGFWGGRFLANETFFMIGFCIKEIQLTNRIKRIAKTKNIIK